MSGEAPSLDDIAHERERQREHQRHVQQLQFDSDGKLTRDYLEGILNMDVVQEKTLNKLRSYIDRNWILSNRTAAEQHDIFYKLMVMEIKIKGTFPPEESSIQGPLRAFLLDDEAEDLFALSAAERSEIESFFDTVRFAILPRGREGFERKHLVTQVRESRTESDTFREEGGKGRIRGLFS